MQGLCLRGHWSPSCLFWALLMLWTTPSSLSWVWSLSGSGSWSVAAIHTPVRLRVSARRNPSRLLSKRLRAIRLLRNNMSFENPSTPEIMPVTPTPEIDRSPVLPPGVSSEEDIAPYVNEQERIDEKNKNKKDPTAPITYH